MKPIINHLAKERRFTTTVDGHEAHVDYVISEGALVVTHTFVPKAIKGRGIA
jgi:predicted GNAT family acetyltransferase